MAHYFVVIDEFILLLKSLFISYKTRTNKSAELDNNASNCFQFLQFAESRHGVEER